MHDFVLKCIRLKYIRLMLSLVCVIVFMSLWLPAAPSAAECGTTCFDSLTKRLVRDGFDKGRIETLYSRPQVSFDTQGVSLFFQHRESKLNYDQFASKKSIGKARSYIENHKDTFARTEKTYGVDKEVIAAIILVETRLGTYVGNRSVLNTLSTMAALADQNVRDMLWEKISDQSRLTRKDYDKWNTKKSKWAYDELKAFLQYADREGFDPVDINGSYAGALGISQFMPSNVLAHAKDGNTDGRVDLFEHADAITSIASYLKHYGWHPQIDKKRAYKVIYRYNRSKYYVNTILKISDLLKG